MLHPHPHIVIFEDIPEPENEDDQDIAHIKRQYAVVVDNISYSKVNNLIDALQLLIATYFNFNRVYPKACACFLEFIQRRFLSIFPYEGNRSKNKEIVIKVERFIQKTQKIEL